MGSSLSGMFILRGLWGDYSYLPAVAFVSGVPGQSYSYRFDWYTNEAILHVPPLQRMVLRYGAQIMRMRILTS